MARRDRDRAYSRAPVEDRRPADNNADGGLLSSGMPGSQCRNEKLFTCMYMYSPSGQKCEEQVIATNLGLILDIERLLGQPHTHSLWMHRPCLAERLSAKLRPEKYSGLGQERHKGHCRDHKTPDITALYDVATRKMERGYEMILRFCEISAAGRRARAARRHVASAVPLGGTESRRTI